MSLLSLSFLVFLLCPSLSGQTESDPAFLWHVGNMSSSQKGLNVRSISASLETIIILFAEKKSGLIFELDFEVTGTKRAAVTQTYT